MFRTDTSPMGWVRTRYRGHQTHDRGTPTRRRDGTRDGSPTPPEGAPGGPGRGLAVLIVTSEAPPVISGISTTVALLRRGLQAQGHRVDIVSRNDFPRFVRGEIRLSALAFYWPSLRRRLSRYDVVNLHGPVPTISDIFLLLSRTLPRQHRPAIVYTHHSDLSISSLEPLCSVYNGIAGRMAHSADAIVVSSGAYHAKLRRPSGKPVSVIPWAIAPTGGAGHPAAAEPQAAPRDDGRLRVLFVGQLRSYKGLHVLLDAVQGLRQVIVTIVGDGPLRAELERRIAQTDAHNVTLTGRLSDADLQRAYVSHDVVVLPSTTTAEAYGMVLAEGMAAGCVPVASALPGVSELAGQTGLLFPPGDQHALRAALLHLAEQPALLRQLSGESRARSRHLSMETMTERYESVFRSAVASTAELRAADAVPGRWANPDDMLLELSATTGVSRSNLYHLARASRTAHAQVWTGSSTSFRGSAPAARLVANLNRPVLLAPGLDWDQRLPPQIRRPESTSAMLLPVHWTRRSTSVIELWTTEEDRIVLGRADLSKVLGLVVPQPSRAGT